jgi:hypothetical protein
VVAVTGVVCGLGVALRGRAAFTEGDNQRIPKRKIKLNATKAARKRVELRFLDFMILFNLTAFDNKFITCYNLL